MPSILTVFVFARGLIGVIITSNVPGLGQKNIFPNYLTTDRALCPYVVSLVLCTCLSYKSFALVFHWHIYSNVPFVIQWSPGGGGGGVLGISSDGDDTIFLGLKFWIPVEGKKTFRWYNE